MPSNQLRLTRSQLASFLKDPESIRRFEQLFSTVDTDFTSIFQLVAVSQDTADSALSVANQAVGMVVMLRADGVGYIAIPGTARRTVQNRLDEVVSAKNFGAVGDGSDATSAIQSAIDSTTEPTAVYVPPGDYLISSKLNLRSGTTIFGAGRDSTRLLKSDFSGPAIEGVDVDSVTLQDFAIVGPGFGVGSGNKGIDIHIDVNQICKAPSLRNLLITDLNDVGVYMGTCSYASWSNVRATNIGYCGLWIDGGDGHNLDACSTQYSLIGFYVNNPSGYGPTTVTMQACYAEQAGRGVWFNGAVCCTASGCGVEAAINFDATHCGINWTITGGEAIALLQCLSRNDTVGSALPITSPHVLIDGSAAQILVDGFRRENHATFPTPTWEIDAQNATSVILGRNNFTGGTILSSGKISTIDTTVVP